MDIRSWWPLLSVETATWLTEHNGEPLDPAVKADVLAAAGGVTDPSWWTGESADGGTELSDAAVDWIESVANGEVDSDG